MSNKKLPKQQYPKAPMPGTSAPGEIEAWGLTQAALRMMGAQESGEKDAMIASVRLNWRLWTIFQAELLDPNSTVPEELRNNILTLAQFIDKHTLEFLGKPTPEKMAILISINRDLAAGIYEPNREETSKPDSTSQDNTPSEDGTSVKISV